MYPQLREKVIDPKACKSLFRCECVIFYLSTSRFSEFLNYLLSLHGFSILIFQSLESH